MRRMTNPALLAAILLAPASAWAQRSGNSGGYWSDVFPDAEVSAAPAPQQNGNAYQPCRDAYIAKRFNEAFPLCKQAAAQGNVDAKEGLAMMYYYGEGVNRDFAQAAYYMEPLYHRNGGMAFALGMIYYRGLAGKRDYCRAKSLYAEAAQKGSAEAYSQLGYIDELGQCGQRDRDLAIQEFDSATSLGDRYTPAIARILRDHGTPTFQNVDQMNKYINSIAHPDPCLSPDATPAFKLAMCGIQSPGLHRGPVFSCSDGMSIGRPCAGN